MIPKIISQKAYADLVNERESLAARIKELESENLNLKSNNQTSLDELTKSYETKISELESRVKAESQSSESKAIKTLAQIGVNVDELPKVTKNQPSVMDGIKGLQGEELSNYFMKNRAAIFRELKQKNAAKKTN